MKRWLSQYEQSDVYVDPGGVEYVRHPSGMIKQMIRDIEFAMDARVGGEYGVVDLSSHSQLETRVQPTIMSRIGSTGVRLCEIEMYTLRNDRDEIESLYTVILRERLYIRQHVLAMATEHVGDLHEVDIAVGLEDRYVIERYIDGHCEAFVEQIDMTRPDGARTIRPMMRYDAVELLRQVEQPVIV